MPAAADGPIPPSDDLIPPENQTLYRILYLIEVGLRELIIEELSLAAGSQWYKHRLPGDVLAKCNVARAREKATRWTQFVHHDPLYYVDFPHLASILERADNWSPTFESIFGRKDVFLASLRSIEELRNKVAHNRKATATDVALASKVYQQFIAAIGYSRTRELVLRTTNAYDAIAYLQAIEEEINFTYQCCESCQPLAARTAWTTAQRSRWLPILAIDHDIAPIAAYYSALDQYDTLPSSWAGYKVQQWQRANSLQRLFQNAGTLVSTIRKGLADELSS